MDTTITVECRACGYITDLSIISDTNPTICPECGGVLFVAGTEKPYVLLIEEMEVEE
jgi:uncharacterized paraquat-inducible protein A